MKIKIIALFLIGTATAFAQDTTKEPVFKKRVLETTEVDFLASYYTQDGSRSAVSGGLGSEKLSDVALTH